MVSIDDVLFYLFYRYRKIRLKIGQIFFGANLKCVGLSKTKSDCAQRY